MIKLSAIIMAAGFSRRMGENKLLLKLGDKTMLERVLEAVSSANVNERILVAKDGKLLHIGSSYGFKPVYNRCSQLGQSASVKLGLLNADKNADYIFFAADQPFITSLLINSLINEHKASPGKITVPVSSGKRTNPVIFPNSFRSELLKLEGDRGGRTVILANIERLNCVEISDEKLLCDIDAPEDFEIAAKWLAEGR